MKVLLTGATGFIGSQLARRLVSEGHELGVVARSTSKLDALQVALPKVQVHKYDGTYESLLRALDVARPDLVIHVASLFIAQHKPEDIAYLMDSNLTFPAQLLEAMSHFGIKQLINTGTSWQHYLNLDYSPVNLYSATKQAFEALLSYYVEAQDFRALTLKLFDTYGPGDTRPKLFSLLRKAAGTGETLRMSPGEQILDMVYISDVLDAYCLAMTRLVNMTGAECYAVSNPNRLSLRKLVQVYSETVRRPINVEWGGLPYRQREVFEPWSNHQPVPGWHARFMLADGITRMEQDRSIGGLLVEQVT